MSGNFGCDLCILASMEAVALVVVMVLLLLVDTGTEVVEVEAGTVVVEVEAGTVAEEEDEEVTAPSCVGVEGRLSSGGSLLICPLVIAEG